MRESPGLAQKVDPGPEKLPQHPLIQSHRAPRADAVPVLAAEDDPVGVVAVIALVVLLLLVVAHHVQHLGQSGRI